MRRRSVAQGNDAVDCHSASARAAVLEIGPPHQTATMCFRRLGGIFRATVMKHRAQRSRRAFRRRFLAAADGGPLLNFSAMQITFTPTAAAPTAEVDDGVES